VIPLNILSVPSSALVVLVGAAGAGKSTFARTFFRATEILSSDFFRGMVSDDEGAQEATADAFELLHLALEKRLRRGKLCVVDATNVQMEHRVRLIEQARRFARPVVAIVLETPDDICITRAGSRTNRMVRPEVVLDQLADLKRGFDGVSEGFSEVFRLNPADQIEIRRI
jgi:protein phosphatase